MAHNTYTASLTIAAPPHKVYSYLVRADLARTYLPDITVDCDVDARGALGQLPKWRESRRGLLFLRDWAEVEFTDLVPGKMVAFSMDDGGSCIRVKYHIEQSHLGATTIIREEVQCFTRIAGGSLSPSERLACMYKKHDQKLRKLKEHLEPSVPAVAPRSHICNNTYVDFSFPVLAS